MSIPLNVRRDVWERSGGVCVKCRGKRNLKYSLIIPQAQGGTAVADDDAPFADIHGPGLRAVYDLADLDQSLFVIATGQSGNPLSPYYRDFVRLWRDGSMVALGSTLAGAPLATTELKPR